MIYSVGADMEGAGIYTPAPNGHRYFCTPGVIAGSDDLVFFSAHLDRVPVDWARASPLSSGADSWWYVSDFRRGLSA